MESKSLDKEGLRLEYLSPFPANSGRIRLAETGVGIRLLGLEQTGLVTGLPGRKTKPDRLDLWL